MDVFPAASGKALTSYFEEGLAEVDQVDGVKVGNGKVVVPESLAIALLCTALHFLNVPASAAADIHPDLGLDHALRPCGNRLRLEVSCQQLQHCFAPFQEVGASRVVHVRLTAVERIQSVLLFPALGRLGEGFEEAIPHEPQRSTEQG